MSELGGIENAVVTLIGGILSGGQAAFRSVAGFSGADRRKASAFSRSLNQPAAVVAYAGRLRGDAADAIVGLPKLSVFVSAVNLRGGKDPRIGDSATLGGFDLLGLTMSELD